MLPKELKKHTWIKNWSGTWKTAFASLYWLYTTSLEPYVGRNLKVNLLVCEKTSSSNYISEEDIYIYGMHVAEKIVNDETYGEKLAKDTLDSAEKVFESIHTIKEKEKPNEEDLLDLKKRFYTHIAPHFSLKKVIDYLPKDIQKKLSPVLVEARIKIENLFNEVDFALRKYTDRIAKEKNISSDLTNFLTIDEINNYLITSECPDEEELIARSNGLVIFCEGNKLFLFTGPEYEELQNILVDTTKTELKGTAGFKGVATGIVRIVFDPNNVKKFNEGDILVTGMTRPEFLPLMKKAAGFVTDAGGMLSHAAIVARELGKPCLLATQTATKIFKDGDIVEVDANRGIVRKI